MTELALPAGILVGIDTPADHLVFTLSEGASDDPRVITVASVPESVAELTERCLRWPHAAAVCDDVLQILITVAKSSRR